MIKIVGDKAVLEVYRKQNKVVIHRFEPSDDGFAEFHDWHTYPNVANRSLTSILTGYLNNLSADKPDNATIDKLIHIILIYVYTDTDILMAMPVKSTIEFLAEAMEECENIRCVKFIGRLLTSAVGLSI